MQAAQLPPVIDERKHRTLPVNPLFPGGQLSKIGASTEHLSEKRPFVAGKHQCDGDQAAEDRVSAPKAVESGG